MSITLGARIAGLTGLFAFASLASGQTIETFAGGRQFTDTPALGVPVMPGGTAFTPDGKLLVSNLQTQQLFRLDLQTGTATTLPGLPDRPVFEYIRDVAVDPSGTAYAVYDTFIVRLNFEWGGWEHLSGGGYNGPTHCSGYSAYPASYQQIADISTGPSGDIYVADAGDHSVCRVSPNGSSSLFAGSGFRGFGGDGGPAQYASLNWPRAVAADAAGNIYIADTGNYRIRKVSIETGTITTIAGTGNFGFNGDGIPATTANLSQPMALAVDATGNVYLFESGTHVVRRVDAGTGIISTVAGNGVYGSAGDGGPATAAELTEVTALTVAANGDLFISDTMSRRLRRVAHDTGIISTVLGNGETAFCGDDVPRRDGCLYLPQGLAADGGGNLFIADAGNGRLRTVSATTGTLSTLAGLGSNAGHSGDGGPAVNAGFGDEPKGVARDTAGNLYIAGGFDHRIRRIDSATGVITTVAGTGTAGFSGDGGPATLAMLNYPTRVVIDPAGNLYFSDVFNQRVRKIAAGSGIITTVAGTGLTTGALGDGGPGTAASLSYPGALAIDPAGRLLIVDESHARLRKLDPATGLITTAAGNGTWSMDGDGGLAINAGIGGQPQIALDPAGNIFLAASYRLRRIDAATGIINDAVLYPWAFYTQEGKTIQQPSGMTFDSAGDLYISDASEDRVFRVKGLNIAAGDTSPPVIEPNVQGAEGNAGWYVGDVQVSWSVTDPESAITSKTGCDFTGVFADTTGVTFTCTATSTGGTASSSVTIRRDATRPTLVIGTPSPAPDAYGWNSTDVSLPFTYSDATSGVASTSPQSPILFTEESVGTAWSVVVTDVAGNFQMLSTPFIAIDRTPPVITPLLTGTLGNNGWYKSDVQLSWSIAELPGSVRSVGGCADTSVTTDTTGVTFSCGVTSAGGTASSSVTVKRDATPPVLTFGAFSPAPNANGWNKTNVNVPFTRSDALSGIASTSASSPLALSAEGAGVTGQVTVTDLAGNARTFTSAPRNIDKTAPSAEINSPVDNATYGFYADVVADYVCDDVSLVSCTGPVANGEMVNTKTAGSRTFKITAKDQVNFTATHTHAFDVASAFDVDGFLAPLNAPPVLNLVARGSLVPVRWRLPDGRGGFVTNPASFVSATVQSFSCSGPVVPLNDVASGGAGLNFDTASGTFTYNWATNAGWTGCRKLIIKLKDNSTHEARFRFQ